MTMYALTEEKPTSACVIRKSALYILSSANSSRLALAKPGGADWKALVTNERPPGR
jgi:hypothetical protein